MSKKATKVNILKIPEGPITAIQGDSKSSGGSNSAASIKDEPISQYETIRFKDETLAPVISGEFNILEKIHEVYLDELPPNENFEFLTGKHNYEIKASNGDRLYVASDVSQPTCCCHGGNGHHSSFCINVYDYLGRQDLFIDGHLAGCASGACVKVFTANAYIGAIIQGGASAPHYVLVNWQGKEVFTIHHAKLGSLWHNLKLERVNPSEFGIYKTNEIDKKLVHVGMFKPVQNKKAGADDKRDAVLSESIQLSFPAGCKLHYKLILIGALFVVDYRMIKREGREALRGHGRHHRFITIPCIGMTFALIMALSIFGVLIYEFVISV